MLAQVADLRVEQPANARDEAQRGDQQRHSRAEGIAHQLVNRTDGDVLYLEIGDRTPGDEGSYPRDDLKASLGSDGRWVYSHKDGRPY